MMGGMGGQAGLFPQRGIMGAAGRFVGRFAESRGWGDKALQDLTGSITQGVAGAIGGAFVAMPYFQQGGGENIAKGFATVAAGIIATVLGGSPVWGFIGAQIASAFMEEAKVDILELENAIRQARRGEFTAAGRTEEERMLNEAQDLLKRTVPLGLTGITQYAGTRLYRRPVEQMVGAEAGELSQDRLNQYFQMMLLGGLAGLTREEFQDLGMERPEVTDWLGGYFADAWNAGVKSPEARERARELLDALLEAVEDETQATDFSTPFGNVIANLNKSMGDIAEKTYEERRIALREEVSKGLAGVREMREFAEGRRGFTGRAVTMLAGLGPMGAERLGAGTEGEALAQISEMLTQISPEEREIFVEMAEGVGDLYNQIMDLREAEAPIAAINQKTSEMSQAQRDLAMAIKMTIEGQRYAAYEMPQVIGVAADATRAELERAVADARELSQQQKESYTLDLAEQQKISDSWGVLALMNVESYEIGMQGITDVNAEILQEILEQRNLIADQMSITFERAEITPEQFPQLQAWMNYYRQLFEGTPGGQAFLEQQDVADILIMLSDRSFRQFDEYQIIFQLAMDELIRLNEEQLEGVFNLPEGMAAAIPWTGRLYFSTSPIAQPSPVSFPEVDANTIATDANTEALMANTEAQQFEPGPYPLFPWMTPAPGFEDMGVTQPLGLEEGLREMYWPTTTEEAPGTALEVFSQQLLDAFDTYLLALMPGRTEGPLAEPYQLPGTMSAEQLGDPTYMSQLNDLARFAREMLTGMPTPELSPMITPPEGPLGGMPETIPITNNIRFNATIPIFIDSTKIQEALQDKLYTDFVNARRRTGTIGYVVS
jgi:hypothetical protein